MCSEAQSGERWKKKKFQPKNTAAMAWVRLRIVGGLLTVKIGCECWCRRLSTRTQLDKWNWAAAAESGRYWHEKFVRKFCVLTKHQQQLEGSRQCWLMFCSVRGCISVRWFQHKIIQPLTYLFFGWITELSEKLMAVDLPRISFDSTEWVKRPQQARRTATWNWNLLLWISCEYFSCYF